MASVIPLPLSTWLSNPSGTWLPQWSRLKSCVGHEPCHTTSTACMVEWAMKFCWGSSVTSTGIYSIAKKSLFIWDIRGFMLKNVGKRSNNTSSSSRLGTSTDVVRWGCALRVESSPKIVIIFPKSWKEMLSTSVVLSAGKDEGVETADEWGQAWRTNNFSRLSSAS